MESYAVIISKVEFHVPETGFSVLSCDRHGSKIRVVGDFVSPVVGEEIEIHGAFSEHALLGACFTAGVIARSAEETALAEHDFTSRERHAIMQSESPFDVESITLERANAAAEARGHSPARRIENCIRAVLWRQPLPVGIKQDELERIVSRITKTTAIEANHGVLALARIGVVGVTKNGTVVQKAALGFADRIIASTPPDDPASIVDDHAFARLYDLPECSPNILLPGEKQAVLHCLNHTTVVVDIASKARAEMIATSVAACAAALERPVPAFFFESLDGIETAGPMVVFCDLNQSTAYASTCRALIDSHYASVFHAPSYAESPLSRAMDEIGNRGLGMSFTSFVTPEGVTFAEGFENDESITHIGTNDVAESLMPFTTGDSLILAPTRGGDLGAMQLSREIHERQTGFPVAGSLFLGERVNLDGVLCEVSLGDDGLASLAWVTTLDVARAQDRKWKTVVVVLDRNPRGVNAAWIYGALSLATDRFVVVGAPGAKVTLLRTTLPVDRAVFDRAMAALEMKEVA